MADLEEATLPLSPEELGLWRGFRKMAEGVQFRIARDLTEWSELTGAEFGVLFRLSAEDGHAMRQQDLADALLWEKSRLSHLLARMKQSGLVERYQPPRGSALIRMTAEGERKLIQAQPVRVASVRKHLLDKLSSEQRARLAQLIDTLV